MRIILLLIVSVSFVEAFQVEQTKKSSVCSVAGSVSNVITGQPLRNAEIQLADDFAKSDKDCYLSAGIGQLVPLSIKTNAKYSTVSQADGTFCFGVVKSGEYKLSGSKKGFVRTVYGTHSSFQSGNIIEVGKKNTGQISLPLIPLSVISGKVLGISGDPAVGTFVSLLAQVWIRGVSHLIVSRSVQANDLGEFRIPYVSEGSYYLVTQDPPEAEGGGRQVTLNDKEGQPIRTFYPGVGQLSQASPIEVQRGQDTTGINIQMLIGQTFHVRGRVASGAPLENGSVNLRPEGEDQLSLAIGGGLRKNGSFDFAGVSPGRYVLSYFLFSENIVKSSHELVEVQNRDVELQIGEGVTTSLKLRIDFENTPANNLDVNDVSKLNFALVTADALIGPEFRAKFVSGNTFELDDVASGVYRLQASAPSGAYVKAILLGQANIVGKKIDLSSGTGGVMEVVYRFGLAKLVGSLEQSANGSEKGNQVPSHILLIPAETDMDPSDLQFSDTDGGGNFIFNDLVPGNYRVVALSSVDYVALQNPTYLNALKTLGREVILKENGSAAATLQLTLDSQVEAQFRSLKTGG